MYVSQVFEISHKNKVRERLALTGAAHEMFYSCRAIHSCDYKMLFYVDKKHNLQKRIKIFLNEKVDSRSF